MTPSRKPIDIAAKQATSRLHQDIVDVLMTQALEREPERAFTMEMVRPRDQAAFQEAFDRLIALGCLPNTLLYCLSYVRFHRPQPLPTAAGMRSLGKRMRAMADAICKIESAGYLSPLDMEKVEGLSVDDLSENAWCKPIAELPSVLHARAADYERWADLISKHRLRRDLVRRVSRLAPSVYVKFATARLASAKEEAEIRQRQQRARQKGQRRLRSLGREPDAVIMDALAGVHPRSLLIEEHRAQTVAKLISATGCSADAGTLRRELREFELYYVDSAGILLGKLMRHHESEAKGSGQPEGRTDIYRIRENESASTSKLQSNNPLSI